MNRAKSAKLLVQHGAPAGVHDNTGNSALTLLIEKLPHVAIAALDQFHSISTINRKEFFFLNYLGKNKKFEITFSPVTYRVSVLEHVTLFPND